MAEQPHQGPCEVNNSATPKRYPSQHPYTHSIPLSTPATAGLTLYIQQLPQLDTPNTSRIPQLSNKYLNHTLIGHNNPPPYHFNGRKEERSKSAGLGSSRHTSVRQDQQENESLSRPGLLSAVFSVPSISQLCRFFLNTLLFFSISFLSPA
jgi:hypothetical protein